MGAGPRPHPTAKGLDWVSERSHLPPPPPDVEDVVLTSPVGVDGGVSLYEGTSSTFYAVDAAGALHTAPVGEVLNGTLRAIVLLAAADLGVTIVQVAPNRDAASLSGGASVRWVGAGVSSTSRLFLPVVGVALPGGGDLSFDVSHPQPRAPLVPGAVTTALADRVRELLEERSVQVVE